MLSNLTAPSSLGARTQRALYLAGWGHFGLEFCHSFMPVLYPLLIVEMGLSFSQIGLITLVISFVSSFFQPFCSVFSERWGAVRTAAISILWLGALMALVGFAPNFWLLAGLIGLASLGSAAFHPAGAVIASSSGQVKRGLSMSIFSVGGNLGAACSPLWVALWTATLGLRSPLTIFPVALVSAFLLYQQLSTRPVMTKSPGSASHAPLERTVWLGVGLIVTTVIMRSWFQVALMTYLPVWVERTGGTPAQGGQLLSLFLFAIGGGSLLGGLLSDRIGSWRVLTGSMALLAMAYWFFLQGGLQSQALTLLVAGVAVGCTYPTAILLAVDVLPHHAALASGLIMGWGWAPAGLGAWLTGYLADRGSLVVGLQLLLLPPLIGLLCLCVFKVVEPRTRAHAIAD